VPAPLKPPLLARLPAPGREAFLRNATAQTWTRGDLVTRDGDEAASLMAVTDGHLLVRIVTPAGEQVALSVVGPGDVLGEVGLVSRRRERTADAVALDTVTALVLARADFDRVRRQAPEVDDFVMELMARRIDRLSHRVAEAHHVPVLQRVARRLHEVGHLYLAGSGPVHVPLTQQDIAGLAGATRPTVNAALRQLEREGVIRLARGRTELLDLVELRRRCVEPGARLGGVSYQEAAGPFSGR
jgi:CRP/FNR family transcriptional regulator, cyclic AMP receptor protein